jgi:protein-disulfide isomerase
MFREFRDGDATRIPAGRSRGGAVWPLRYVRIARLTASVCLMAASAGAAEAQRKTAEDDLERLSRAGDARAVGPDTARVVVLEFLDFECPVCSAFHTQRGDSLRRSLAADVRVVYVNFPMAQHMRSFHGSEAATCAGAVGGKPGYTGMTDRLFRYQSEWSQSADPAPTFMRFAREAGLDTAAFADCRARDVASPLILADLETAGKFGIGGTPTFIVLPRGATSADDALRVGGNATIAQLTDLIAQARAKSK